MRRKVVAAVEKRVASCGGYIRLVITLPKSLSELKGSESRKYVEIIGGHETLVIEAALNSLGHLCDDSVT